MSLGFPMGLLALGALVPLFVAYFLRRRQKPRVVSALFLWRIPSVRAEAGPKLERFSREASLLLEIAAILAAALFLANLRFGKDASRRHTIVVLDGSLSMNAKTGGETAAQRAVNEVGRVAATERTDLLTVVESGPRPKVIAGPQADVTRALASLSTWHPSQPAHDFGPALMLARELATTKGQMIRLLTDGPPSGDPTWPEEVEVKSVGAAVENLAFLSAQRHDEGGVAHVVLRVASFCKEKRTIAVEVSNSDAQQTETIELDPGASMLVRLALKTNRPLTAKLPADALAQDSEIVLPTSPLAPVTVGLLPGLDAAGEATLRRFIDITPGVELGGEPALTWGPPGSRANVTIGAKGKERSFIGPFFAQKSDPLLDDVRLGGVVWTAGDNPPGRPLISMGDVAMLTAEDDGHLHLNVDLSRSNVHRTAAWPVLLANVVRDARLKLPGFPRKMVMLGEEADVVVDARARWELESPSGVKRPVMGSAARLPVDEAGEWKMFKDGRAFDTLIVLPLDGRESDLSTRGKYDVEARASAGNALGGDSPRPRGWLGLLLLLLLLDFWITASAGFATGRISPQIGASK